MLVTITSDASFNCKNNDAGYAFLISSNVGRFSKSGKLDAKNITEAELMAIANSLFYVCNHPKLTGVSKIIFNIDFIHAESMIMKKGGTKAMQGRKGKKYRIIIDVIRKLRAELRKKGCKQMEFRHVRSHTNSKDKRSKANSYVDKLAVKARKSNE